MTRVGLVLPHTTLHRRLARLEEFGVMGLVDQRHPPQCDLDEAMRGFAVGLRRTSPGLPTRVVAEKLGEAFGWTGSLRQLSAVLRQAGVAHPPGGPANDRKRRAAVVQEPPGAGIGQLPAREARAAPPEAVLEDKELGGAGLALVKVMDEVLGYSQKMAEVIQERALAAPSPQEPIPVDRSHRDERGHFLAEYNAPRPRTDPDVGAAFDSVELKRQSKDLTRLSIRKTSRDTIAAKILALMALPLVSESGRFDGVTEPRGEWLESLGGHDYMPETLMKFGRELKYLGVSEDLIELHAEFWFRELGPSLGEEASQLILYVDATAKPYWTEFFHKSGRVATVGRVMPCLETILIHTGQGVPLYLKTFAGQAPLLKQLLPMIHEMERAIGAGMLGRISVVDGEMNCVALFKQFDADRDPQGRKRKRLFITSLDAPQIADPSRIQERTPWLPYRDGDQICGGTIALRDSREPKAPLYPARAILLKRRTKETVSGYVTNASIEDDLARGVEGFGDSQLLDIYFRRWPAQEHVFRSLNQVVHFKQIHGYGKRKVQNLTVIDEIERLTAQIERTEHRIATHHGRAAEEASQQAALGKDLRQTTRQLDAAGKQRQLVLTISSPEGTQHLRMQDSRTVELEQQHESLQAEQAHHAEQQQRHEQTVEQLQSRVDDLKCEKTQLEERRLIYQTDVELDQILSVFKIGFMLLLQAILHRFFGGLAIDLNRFLVNILALRGRRVITSTTETFYLRANRRNPDLMAKLHAACVELKALGHQRDGRRVRFELSWPPE